jgi:hypothetical protein
MFFDKKKHYINYSLTITIATRSAAILEREKRKKVGGGSERDYIGRGARNYISGFEGSQAVPACPPGIGNAYCRNFVVYI